MDREKAKEIVSRLDIPEDFGMDEQSDMIWQDGLIESQLNGDFGSYSVDNGVSKAVIIFDYLPFVIKIPMWGMWYYHEDYDEENDEYYYSESEFGYFYCGSENNSKDYCLKEFERIQAMIEAGFGKLVPETEWVCADAAGRNFYMQEKVIPYRSHVSKTTPSDASLEKAKNQECKYCSCSADWRAMVIDCYGEQFWKDFVDWDSENEMYILSDMHSGNYGYRNDGSPVLLDIGGFDDN